MSLPPQRLASIGLVAVALGGLLWSEYGGSPIGPSSASANEQGASGTKTKDADAGNAGTKSQGSRMECRVVLAGMLRSYANDNGLDAEHIDDPFVEPASWTAVPVAAKTPQQNRPVVVNTPAPEHLMLTAVMDAPSGAVARVNGVLMVVGRQVELPGVGLVELVEVGLDGRSAVLKTKHGETRVRLNEVIGVQGG